jgi:hypothetical protein
MHILRAIGPHMELVLVLLLEACEAQREAAMLSLARSKSNGEVAGRVHICQLFHGAVILTWRYLNKIGPSSHQEHCSPSYNEKKTRLG